MDLRRDPSDARYSVQLGMLSRDLHDRVHFTHVSAVADGPARRHRAVDRV